jgi:serine/threonine protein kinase
MELSVQNVYGLLLRSKLLPVESARTMYDRWQKESGAKGTSLEQFSRWMVANRFVTEYQAGLLTRGHADGFFIGQYKILDRLGKGRMAGVYEAAHECGQRVAIKVLPPSKARDPHMLARFQREARLAMRLKHPNIVRSFQVGKDGKLYFLVMEYLDGETLDEVLQRRKRLPPAEAVRLIYQALLGLQHIHEQNLVHRDLKPSNLMLVPGPGGQPGGTDTTLNSTVKLLDMGMGRVLFDETIPEKGMALTSEGVVLGTPDYMAPEQAKDARSVDIRADIYSLGCVLYHCLAGQPPFPDTSFINQVIRHATEPPRPLKDLNPQVPDGLQQILNWMLAKDPAQRYPTPDRAAQALRVFLAAGTEPKAPEADAKMHSYLSWLEGENSKADLTMPSPEALAAAAARQAARDQNPSKGKRHPKKHKHQRAVAKAAAHAPPQAPAQVAAVPTALPVATPAKPAAATAIPVAAPAKPAAPTAQVVADFDVELVPVVDLPPSVKKAVERKAGWHLTRRDFLMFGAGVGGTLTAIGLSWLLAHLASGPPPEPKDKGTRKPKKEMDGDEEPQ